MRLAGADPTHLSPLNGKWPIFRLYSTISDGWRSLTKPSPLDIDQTGRFESERGKIMPTVREHAYGPEKVMTYGSFGQNSTKQVKPR